MRSHRLAIIISEEDAARLRRIARRMGMRGASSLVAALIDEGRPLFEWLDAELQRRPFLLTDFIAHTVEFIDAERRRLVKESAEVGASAHARDPGSGSHEPQERQKSS